MLTVILFYLFIFCAFFLVALLAAKVVNNMILTGPEEPELGLREIIIMAVIMTALFL